MRCPHCGLINPEIAQRCDCGYDFERGTIEKPHQKAADAIEIEQKDSQPTVLKTNKYSSVPKELPSTGRIKPWLSIWTRPRKTMRWVLDGDPRYHVTLLAVLSGIANVLDRGSMRSIGDNYSLLTILISAAIAGAVAGVLGLYIAGHLLTWTGRMIGGQASTDHIRAAYAWGSAPFAWSLLLWVPELAVFGKEWFTTTTPKMDENPSLVLGFGLVEMTIFF